MITVETKKYVAYVTYCQNCGYDFQARIEVHSTVHVEYVWPVCPECKEMIPRILEPLPDPIVTQGTEPEVWQLEQAGQIPPQKPA